MGHAARTRKAKRFKLDRGDYFELKAALRELEVLRLEAQAKAARIAAEMVQNEIAAAGQKGQALTKRLASKYGFSDTGAFRLEDATCELVPVETPST